MTRNKNYPLYKLEEYKSLNEMIFKKAEKCKNAVAFQYMRGKTLYSVSYQEFLKDVIITGNYISSHVKCRSHIAILGENSYQWLVVFMAVVMSGNVAVPLDKELDSFGIRELLINSDSVLCIYSSLYGDIADEIQGNAADTDIVSEFISMDIFEELQKSSKQEENVRKADDVDYTILERWNVDLDIKAMAAMFFTSGTSGKSKGVMLSQENMISDINFACKNFSMEGNTLAVLPFHHSFGLLMSVFALFNWEHTIFINSALKNVKRDMLVAKPQTMLLVPLFVETFYKTIWQTAREQGSEKKLQFGIRLSNFLLRLGIDVRRKLFRSVLAGFGGELEYIICGGAPLQEKYVREFRTIGIEILNGYGITECAPVVSTNRNYYHRDGSVGQILQGCSVRIQSNEPYSDAGVENSREKVQADSNNHVIGEIQVKGKNVMLGYYRDEKTTKEVFDDGWFMTGDLGYIDSDGFLYVTGRKKNLIILSNGENVSPEELEALLLDYELVKEVMVYAKDGKITAEIFPDYEMEISGKAGTSVSTVSLANAGESIASSKENIASSNKNIASSKAGTDIVTISGHLQEIIDKCNRSLPVYKRIQNLKIRQSAFEKTTTQKIKR